jgi:hypothetical protein
MKKTMFLVLVIFSMISFVSCGEKEETETINDDGNEIVDEEKNDDAKADDVQEQHDEIADESENIVDDIETIDEIVEENDENQIVDSEQNDNEMVDETEITDENNENPYSCLENPCAVDTDCQCEASWCVIDDDNVSYAGLTKLTCAKKDCTVGDDSTCPLNYTCTEIPGFVLALMPELPKTVCKKK